MRVASIDIGTNTVLLLVCDIHRDEIRVIRDVHAIARLGEGVDRNGAIAPPARERLIGTLREHRAVMDELQVERVAAFATSAMRDAANRDEIIRDVREATGVEIELLSGEHEAHWTWRGALAGLTRASGRVGVLDIGGGSTELSYGTSDNFENGVSMNIGAVRITERCFSTSPITAEAAEDARRTVRAELERAIPAPPALSELIAVAGTPTTLAAMHQGLTAFDRERVKGYTLTRAAIAQLLDIQLKVDTVTLLSHFPAINKARADILPAGTLILAEVMDHLQCERVRVSTRGLRYGIILREAERLASAEGRMSGHVTLVE